MSLTFYYAPQSTASITELLIEELGLKCERVLIDIRSSDRPQLLAVNPNNKVPVLVHDGTPIWESAAITIYLGETFGTEKQLWPAAGPKRGEAMKWVVWSNVTFGDAVYRIGRNTGTWVPSEQQNAKAAEAARAEVNQLLGILDKALTGKQFLVGDYTLADAHVNSFLSWPRHSMGIDFAPFKNVVAWAARCDARPAAKKVNAPA